MPHPDPRLIKKEIIELLYEDFKVECIRRDLEKAGALIEDLGTDNFYIVIDLIGFSEDEKSVYYDLDDQPYFTLIEDMLQRYQFRNPGSFAYDRKEKKKILKDLETFVDSLLEEFAKLPKVQHLN